MFSNKVLAGVLAFVLTCCGILLIILFNDKLTGKFFLLTQRYPVVLTSGVLLLLLFGFWRMYVMLRKKGAT